MPVESGAIESGTPGAVRKAMPWFGVEDAVLNAFLLVSFLLAGECLNGDGLARQSLHFHCMYLGVLHLGIVIVVERRSAA